MDGWESITGSLQTCIRAFTISREREIEHNILFTR